MTPDPHDTIVALSSATGPGGRAIVRLSGPSALACAGSVFAGGGPVVPDRRWSYPGHVCLPEVGRLPADLYFFPGPHTYTGQELVEIHTLSCPPLIDVLIGRLLAAGARAAQPGEFTMRAFLAGKLDLTRAEAVLAVIEAGDRDQLRQALTQLAGGVALPMQKLRDDLLNLLADVEAGLDFTEEDIRFVDQSELLHRLTRGLAQLTLLIRQLEQRAVADRPFRVVLAGRPNAGKSSLFNALTGDPAALVSPEPGTTRDYLIRRLDLDGVAVELVDTAGRREAGEVIEQQAQALGHEQADHADLVLLCLEAEASLDLKDPELASHPGAAPTLPITTKADLGIYPKGRLATSAATGTGLDELRTLLRTRALARPQPALAPSLSRSRHHAETCLVHLRQAHDAVLHEEPAELLAVELRGALDEVGEIVGAVYTDDLLDRIFSRFCIGK